MFKSIKLKTLVIATSAACVIGLVLSSQLDLTRPISAAPSPAQDNNTVSAQTAQTLPDFVSLAKRLSPTVVNISTVQVREAAQSGPNPFGEEHPFNEFWRRFGNPLPRGPSRERSLGSGFIISPDGYILTNNHVVEKSERIVVKLSNEREFDAEVVGKDPKTDVALLKIESKEPLPSVPLGDSLGLQVGEWVLAIGNPFGLEHTVTSGIVSAKGRQIGAGPYDNFIQTDASINPGNSGGPLINRNGEIVGINTAIFSRSGGNIGIGFAIPINLVKELLPQLKDNGKVTRGWLGVTIQKVTPEVAEALGMAEPRGALVAGLSPNGPAKRSGVEIGDVIIEFDETQVKSYNELPMLVARIAVNRKVNLKAVRDAKEINLTVTVGKLKEKPTLASIDEKDTLGLTVQEVTAELAERLGLDSPKGVVITAVESGSVAEDSGLRRGDVILKINRKPIRSLKEFLNAAETIDNGKSTLFLVSREGTTLFFALKNFG